jgi:hypothetical protein
VDGNLKDPLDKLIAKIRGVSTFFRQGCLASLRSNIKARLIRIGEWDPMLLSSEIDIF